MICVDNLFDELHDELTARTMARASAAVIHVIAIRSPPPARRQSELREIVRADDDTLEDYRPWGIDFTAEAPSSELLEDARSMLTCRHLSNAEACSSFADWAHGFAGMVAEYAIPPVFRIGAVAWLARVALGAKDRPA